MSVIFLHSAEGCGAKTLWEILIAQIHLGFTSC